MVLYYLYILINFLKLYHNLFTWLNLRKSYGVRHSVLAGSIPANWSSSPPPPLMLTLYYWGKIIWRRKNYAAAEKLSGLSAAGPKIRKNLTVTKIVAQCRKYPIPLRNHSISFAQSRTLSPIFIHCRSYTLS